MLFLGLLLLACTAAFTGLVLADNLSGGPDYSVTVLGEHIATLNSLEIFCAGLALALIFGLGCVMALAGGALRRRKSRELVAARREAAAAAGERDALAARLESRDTASAPAKTAPAATAPAAIGPVMGEGKNKPGSEPAYGEVTDTRQSGATRADIPPRRHRRNGLHLFGH